MTSGYKHRKMAAFWCLEVGEIYFGNISTLSLLTNLLESELNKRCIYNLWTQRSSAAAFGSSVGRCRPADIREIPSAPVIISHNQLTGTVKTVKTIECIGTCCIAAYTDCA